MSEFNKPEAGLPVVHVAMKASSAVDGRKIVGQMERAKEAGYSLGLKLDQEGKLWTSLDPTSSLV
jgi:hypothetical protein